MVAGIAKVRDRFPGVDIAGLFVLAVGDSLRLAYDNGVLYEVSPNDN